MLVCSESDVEAYHNQQKLQILMEKVLADNMELRQRLFQSEDSFAARSIATRHPQETNSTIHNREDYSSDNDDSSTIREVGRGNTLQNKFNVFGDRVTQFAFDNILERSRVYRKSEQNQECDRSFASTAQRSHAWSVFSGYSLADISIMSVIAMPLTTRDVSNGKYYLMEAQGDPRFLGIVEEEGLYGTANGPNLIIPMDSNPLDNGTLVSVPAVAKEKSDDPPGNELHEFPDWTDELLYDEILPCKGCGEVSNELKPFQRQSLTQD
jgi:hypothetical protein